MKIPRGRQDAHVAGMADFLGRMVGVVARIVIERLDQRGADRHFMSVPKRAAQAGFPGWPVGDDRGDLLVVEAMDRSLSSC